MWTFSELGFASTVSDRTNAAYVIVRFRDPQDAAMHATMHKSANQLKRTPSVWRDGRADYFWRMRVRKEEWAETLASIAEGVDYPNFKSMMHHWAPHWTNRELMGVWSITNDHQRDVVENETVRSTAAWEGISGAEFSDDDEVVDTITGDPERPPEHDENPFA